MQSGTTSFKVSRRHVFCWLMGGASLQIVGLMGQADQAAPSAPPAAGAHVLPGAIDADDGSIDKDLFVVLWKAAFNPVPLAQGDTPSEEAARADQREVAFRHGLVRLLAQSPEGMRRELALFSRAASTGLGRLVLFGIWSPLAQVPPERLRQSLDDMGASRFSFRRKVALGVVLVLGMSHYSRAELYGDAGYPGPPTVIAGLWTSEGRGGAPTQTEQGPGAVP